MRGDPLEVSITIEGFPPPNVMWSLDGVTIGNNPRRTVSSTGLSLSSATPDDAGTYVVTAENGFSSANATFEIIVRCKCLLPDRALSVYLLPFPVLHMHTHAHTRFIYQV